MLPASQGRGDLFMQQQKAHQRLSFGVQQAAQLCFKLCSELLLLLSAGGQLFCCQPVIATSRNQLWFYAEVSVVSVDQLRAWTVGEGSLLQAPWRWAVCAEQENHHPLQEFEGDWNSSWAQGSVRTDWFVAIVAKLCMQSTMGKRERWYFMPEREGKGQERSGRPSCYLERDFKLEVSSWLIPSVFQGKGFLRVSAHSVSLKRNNIPQLLIFSRYFSYKWMIVQNANSLLSGSTVSVSEWKPNYIGFL